MAQFYHVRSGKHFNLNNLSMTVGHQRFDLYTDATGILREIRDGEGHPFISEGVALALKEFPAAEQWLIVPVLPDEPEPPEEVIPVDITPTGQVVQASGTLANRLRESISQVKHRDSILLMYEQQIATLKAQITDQQRQISELERELVALPRLHEPEMLDVEQDNPPAPMIRKGRLAPPRINVPTVLHADDASISTLREAEAVLPVPHLADLDDIPRM